MVVSPVWMLENVIKVHQLINFFKACISEVRYVKESDNI